MNSLLTFCYVDDLIFKKSIFTSGLRLLVLKIHRLTFFFSIAQNLEHLNRMKAAV